ncbi:MAG TPA: patatin-like phospholipase family protein [Xanthobacteraceae bacterium]|nr:patatin-like phospholipase family protein [Xanthobacteraceae bacterium]
MSQGRTPFEQIALLLQGGGALGSYQAGVYEALAEADLQPDWVAGISIGAINSAIIAGNQPEKRVERLREFWHTVSTSPLGIPYFKSIELKDELNHQLVNQARAMSILMFGAPNFFVPRLPPAMLWPGGSPDKASYYDNKPLKATLERLVDFDRINSGEMRFSVGAVDVCSGNFTYFDTTTHKIVCEHVIASGSLPPGFPATKIGDQYFWDGGLISNTPLQWVLDSRPRRDTLAFQIDLWNARGMLPRDMTGVEVRQKEIVYSSRTRAATDQYQYMQKLRIAVANVLKHLPAEFQDSDDAKLLAAEADDKVCNIVHLIYRSQAYEGIAKDFEFSRRTMEEHWKSGYSNARQTLANPKVLQLPDRLDGVCTFDIGEDQSC